jgi:hypothetical protein
VLEPEDYTEQYVEEFYCPPDKTFKYTRVSSFAMTTTMMMIKIVMMMIG